MIITKEDVKKEEINPEDIWAKMVDFGKYGFNKSHSVSYSIIGYHTSDLWVNHKELFLTFELNYDTKKRFQQAIDKCIELGMSFIYPTYKSMIGNEYLVRNNKVYIPGGAKKNYKSVVDFLFNDENGENISNLIFMGVCDNITKDRLALATLATTLLKKPREQAVYMEPPGVEFKKLEDILEGLKQCGGVVDYKKVDDPYDINKSGILVHVKRGRGNPSEVFFHKDNSEYCKANIIEYDLKQFGAVRKDVLSLFPFIRHDAIERNIESLKERFKSKNMEDKNIYYKLKNELDEYMMENHNNPFKNTFEGVYALVDDIAVFDRSIKLVLDFDDKKKEILYVMDKENMKIARTLKKKDIVKMTLIYSPYIQRRTLKFIYDFDIKKLEIIKFDD